MGLDITAFRQLTPTPDVALDSYGAPVEWEKYWRPHAIAWAEKHWPGRAEGVTEGTIYAAAETMNFRAGSYGGYNEWRHWLARVMGYASAQDFWNRAPAGSPFYELINFADNEGVIGPVVAAKLAQDFAENERRAEECAEGSQPFYMDRYRTWKRAFEMAADGGAVDFH
jgi:hypothetical protein